MEPDKGVMRGCVCEFLLECFFFIVHPRTVCVRANAFILHQLHPAATPGASFNGLVRTEILRPPLSVLISNESVMLSVFLPLH